MRTISRPSVRHTRKEIQSTEGGEGLDGLMRAKSFALSGIINGLDYNVFDPKKDPAIAKKLTGDVSSYKKQISRHYRRRLAWKKIRISSCLECIPSDRSERI